MRIIAVDWSGKLVRPEEQIWLAEVVDGELVRLENGRSREQLVAHVGRTGPTIVGLDFAFSFPRWWCQLRGWTDVAEVWTAIAADGERLLASCEWPFWGRSAKPNPHSAREAYRRTEREDAPSAKSVFQIGGAGAVGTGSVRGMRLLPALVEQGFSVWPFTARAKRQVVEIYPRALTGPVRKSRWADRHALLRRRFADQSAAMLERAAGCEDAFDAAVSALVMAEHAGELASLRPTIDPWFAIEGRIWRPGA
jgi:predicted nuclease with RNAse H fold